MQKKRLKIITLSSLLLVILYFFLLSNFNPMFQDKEFVYLTDHLKSSQKEDLKSFTNIYNKVNKVVKEKRCPCEVSTNYIGPYRHGYSLTKLIYHLKIEQEFTNDDCFKFQLLNGEFGHGNIGIEKAAMFYFGKKLQELNEEEKITLLVVNINSGLYDPIRNPEGVKYKVKAYQSRLHKQNK